MKKTLCLTVIAFLFSMNAQAQKRRSLHDEMTGQGYGMAGCGLGSMAFGKQEGMIQIVASTLNGTFGSQTFGITFGTSNCDTGGFGKKAEIYIHANREPLETDISRGEGETLAGLGEILGCPDSKMLGRNLQNKFGEIFPTANIDSSKVTEKIFGIVESSPELQSSCQALS